MNLSLKKKDIKSNQSLIYSPLSKFNKNETFQTVSPIEIEPNFVL